MAMGWRALDRVLDLLALRMEADELHLAAAFAQRTDVGQRAIGVGELVGRDARALAVLEELHRALGREVLLHVPVGVLARVGVAEDRVGAGDEPADAVLAELNRRQRPRRRRHFCCFDGSRWFQRGGCG